MHSLWSDFTLMCAHHLPRLPEAHPCHRLHGHNYRVRLHVRGPIDPFLGWIVDYATIESVWRTCIHDVLDHRLLNDTIDNPTCENLAAWICERMNAFAVEWEVFRVEVQEEPNNGVIYEPAVKP